MIGPVMLLVALAVPPAAGVQVLSAAVPQPPPGAATAAIYLSLRNAGPLPDRLLAVTTPVAGQALLHTSQVVDGVARMQPESGLLLPAGGQLAMHPGGTHVMLMDLRRPLRAGDHFPLALRFAQAGTLQAEATVLPLGSRP